MQASDAHSHATAGSGSCVPGRGMHWTGFTPGCWCRLAPPGRRPRGAATQYLAVRAESILVEGPVAGVWKLPCGLPIRDGEFGTFPRSLQVNGIGPGPDRYS